MNADRKAFDELWTLSQTPQHPYQDLARRAAEAIVLITITLSQDPALTDRLQQRDYAELLQYYRNTTHAQSPSVLYAADGNQHMTEEEKDDFMAIMIDEDGSLHIVQRACLVIRARLEKYQQAKPARHARVMAQSQEYGKVWDYHFRR